MLNPLVFIVVAASILFLIGWYTYRRVIRDVSSNRTVRIAAIALGVVFVVGMPLIIYLRRNGIRVPRGVTVGWLSVWGLIFYCALALAVADLVLLLRRLLIRRAAEDSPERRQFLKQVSALGAVAVAGGGVSLGAYQAFAPPDITEFSLKLPGLDPRLDGFSIVQLTDIHIGPVLRERFLDRLVDMSNRLKPDLVAVVGDLVDGTPDELGGIIARLTRMQSKFGTHFVSGNHEYYAGWEPWVPRLEALGITVLRNRTVRIGGPEGFDLVGVDDWSARRTGRGYDLSHATAGRDKSVASVLLAHQPSGMELAAEAGMGLQLSGHTHGGQTFPTNFIGDVIWGNRNHGLSKFQQTHLYTSRGCGFVGPPSRLFVPPEIVKIVLTPG